MARVNQEKEYHCMHSFPGITESSRVEIAIFLDSSLEEAFRNLLRCEERIN